MVTRYVSSKPPAHIIAESEGVGEISGRLSTLASVHLDPQPAMKRVHSTDRVRFEWGKTMATISEKIKKSIPGGGNDDETEIQ